MKLGAIDIGSNSIHLIIADLYPDGHYAVVDKAKDMVGLASGTVSSGYLSDEVMRRGIDALRRFRDLCLARGVDTISAVATSAVREAVNGEYFVERVRQECDIQIEVIGGREEARLIYLGARDQIDWAGRRALLVDIGGGSVEFIVGDAQQAEVFVSLPIGVRRLSERFLTSDPPKKTELKQLKAYLDDQLQALREHLKDHPFDFVVGTSGTLKNLAQLAARRNGEVLEDTHGAWTRLSDLKEMGRALSGLRAAERGAYHGLNVGRTDTIVAGAQLIKYILRAVDKDCYVACDFALREGLIVDYMDRARLSAEGSADLAMRKRSVRQLMRRFNVHGNHPDEVARLTLSLFDQLRDLHCLEDDDRELLKFAGLLYDVGSSIHKENRHLHSAYLVENGVLPGFNVQERGWLSWLVRLRRDPALRDDPALAAWEPMARRRLLVCAALLRLGVALDRSRSGSVVEVRAQLKRRRLHLELMALASTGMELRAVEERSDLLAEVFGLKVSAALTIVNGEEVVQRGKGER
jgi:exopolyphosphatase/guanosine-5'-triphosphate,3'-diphosphate pyrophosphatase